jgi:hypothetical protein
MGPKGAGQSGQARAHDLGLSGHAKHGALPGGSALRRGQTIISLYRD